MKSNKSRFKIKEIGFCIFSFKNFFLKNIFNLRIEFNIVKEVCIEEK